jgi:hypothetical protein
MPTPPPPSSTPPKASGPFAMPTAATLRPKILMYAEPGWGKTSTMAFAPNVAIVSAAGEDGYQSLLNAGRVPPVPHKHVASWEEALSLCDDIAATDGIDIVAFDAVRAFDDLCAEHVCKVQFKGQWGANGFDSYGKGNEAVSREWIRLLAACDRIQRSGKTVVWLGHSLVKPFQNPIGADYDRFIVDCRSKTSDVLCKWASDIMFGRFFSSADAADENSKVKAASRAAQRILYCENRPSYLAKSQSGFRAEIDISNDPKVAWSEIIAAREGALS